MLKTKIYQNEKISIKKFQQVTKNDNFAKNKKKTINKKKYFHQRNKKSSKV